VCFMIIRHNSDAVFESFDVEFIMKRYSICIASD
jgi:hypothetical protein